MSGLSANQQRLISRIIFTSHAHAFCHVSLMAAASCAMCYYSGDVIHPLIDVTIILVGLTLFRLGRSTISELKAYRFEHCKTVGLSLNATLQDLSTALTVKTPLLYIFPEKSRVAYCSFTASFRWIVLVSEGLEKADDQEQISILAHELGHRKCLHGLVNFIKIGVIVMLVMSTESLCEAKGLAFYATALFAGLNLAVAVLCMAASVRQQELHADAIATVLNGKEALINNFLEDRIPRLAAIAHHLRPDLSEESLARHLAVSPERLQLVLTMESADSRSATGLFAKLKLLHDKLLDAHPTLSQRVKNIEKFERLTAA